MSDPSDIGSLTLAVGEMRGQLREMIHTQNNTAQKVDGIYATVLRAPTAEDFAKLSGRVDTLESERDRRDGATGLGAAILKSPAIGWLVGIVVGAYALIKGT